MNKAPNMADPLDLDPNIRDALLLTGTAPISSQLLKRGLRHVFIARSAPISRSHARMVGPAYTLRFIPMREDLAVPGSVANTANPQRAAIERVPAGHVLVIDAGGELGSGCLGDILAARLHQRGVAGVVTDGAVRDSQPLKELALPIFACGIAAPPSFALMMAADSACPIACGGVAVFPGDIVVGDEDGAVVIPRHLAAEVGRDAAEQERVERFVRRRVDRGASIVGLYPPNDEAMAAYRRWVDAGESDAAL
jgi:regulator of RNase E activity RraA